MKEQTAMQELIEQAKTGKEFSKDGFVTWEEVIEAATELLTKEREQIKIYVIDFALYLEKLPTIKRFSVHPAAGTGSGIGLYEKTIEQIYEDYFTTTYKQPL